MSDETEDHWQSYPPWIVFDPDTKAEFVTPETLRYYVVHVGDKWFICDRFLDTRVPETESTSRAEAIRKFYLKMNRPIPKGWDIPGRVAGTEHGGIG